MWASQKNHRTHHWWMQNISSDKVHMKTPGCVWDYPLTSSHGPVTATRLEPLLQIHPNTNSCEWTLFLYADRTVQKNNFVVYNQLKDLHVDRVLAAVQKAFTPYPFRLISNFDVCCDSQDCLLSLYSNFNLKRPLYLTLSEQAVLRM